MDGVRSGGQRRIDRVLESDYLDRLHELPMDEVRALRVEADQEETDLSYLRRLLQARLDLVTAEMARRDQGGEPPTDLVAHLTAVLSDGPRGAAHGLGRHSTTEPSRAGESRRHVEQLVSDGLLTDLPGTSDADLNQAIEVLRSEETIVSEQRGAVQRVLDAVTAEVGRRYRDGEASIESLLTDEHAAEI